MNFTYLPENAHFYDICPKNIFPKLGGHWRLLRLCQQGKVDY